MPRQGAQAVRAALELRDAIPDATAGLPAGPVAVRVAVDTGMAIVTGDEHVDGMGCGAAASADRLLARTQPGTDVVGPAAARMP